MPFISYKNYKSKKDKECRYVIKKDMLYNRMNVVNQDDVRRKKQIGSIPFNKIKDIGGILPGS